ncbi:MAG TPA: CoA transferase subunit A [Negativicutes bacterium]|nr:CoA transferase subunit A [Negativicutes bacterium]
MKKVIQIMSCEEAIKSIAPHSRVMVGGFGLRGYPEDLVDALAASGIGDLTIISNDLGSPGIGLGKLLTNNQIKGLEGNYYNWNPEVAAAYNEGKIKVNLLPQGTFAEGIRAAGAGIPAFYTLASVGTELAKGKETRTFGDKEYVLEYALPGDVALLKAEKADELGNLVYCKSARNFNPIMAMAAKYVIVEVGEIVAAGELDPECIVTPHMFVDVLVLKGR